MYNYDRYLHSFAYLIAEKFSGRNIGGIYKSLKEADHISKANLEKLQLTRLKEILKYSYRHVPYYKKLFDECNFNPEKFNCFKDIEKIPYLTKDIVRENESLFISSEKDKRLISRKTGGSTGNKLTVYYDLESLDVTAAVNRRCLEWVGKPFGCGEIHFSSNIHDEIPFRDKLKETIKCLAHNRLNITVDIFDNESLRNILSKIQKKRPVLIQGFPSIAYELARYAENNNLNVYNAFQLYIATGETLYDFQKEKIEKVFGCKVFNRYGNAEFGIIAHECKLQNGLHIQSDIVFTETVLCEELNEELNEELDRELNKAQEIVATTLTNYVMPLIRYKTGDIGEINRAPCLCGLPYPKIINIKGRIHDFFSLGNGRRVSTFVILDITDKYGGVNNFQVRKSQTGLELYILPEISCSIGQLRKIKEAIINKHSLKNEKVDLYLVDKLQVTTAGKYRYTVTEPIKTDKRTIIADDVNGLIYNCSQRIFT